MLKPADRTAGRSDAGTTAGPRWFAVLLILMAVAAGAYGIQLLLQPIANIMGGAFLAVAVAVAGWGISEVRPRR
ncbi:MAG TPA: hypothetical protein VIM34_13840 [Burkholderiaceae bacterium]